MSEETIESIAQAAEAVPDAEAPASGGREWPSAFRAMRHRNFRLFFGGQFTSLIGTWMQTVAQAWLVLKLTNSPLMLGVVSFASYFPIVLVALFAGVVVDYVDRRRLLIIAQTLLMLNAFILAWLTYTGMVRVEHVIILAALNGLISSFDMPGRQAFVVEMVGMEDLPNAIALNSMIFNAARTVGPAVAGLLIATVGTAMCFFINGVSYLAVIWSLFEMKLARRLKTSSREPVLAQLREGLSYAWRHQAIFYLLMLVAINTGLGAQYAVLMPVFARDILHGGASAYGLLMGAQGVGAVIGAMTLASRGSSPKALGQNLLVGLCTGALAIFMFGLSPWMALSLIAQMMAGAGVMTYMASTNTLLQLYVSDELRGRLMSLYTMSFIGVSPIGALAVGFIGEHLSPRIAVTICGLTSIICALILLVRLPAIAGADAEPRSQPA